MIILAVNLIAVLVVALINVDFVISFEVAFVGALLVFYSSYRAVIKKMGDFNKQNANPSKDSNESESSGESNADSNDSPTDSPQKPENLSKKERFFIGFKISFGLLRLLSYAFLGISIIALINNGAFHILPFLAGIATSSLSSAIFVAKRRVN